METYEVFYFVVGYLIIFILASMLFIEVEQLIYLY